MWAFSVFCGTVWCWAFCSALQFNDVAERGRRDLQKVHEFAAHPKYGECWSRALQKIHSRCRAFTEETQSRIALAFTHCHLQRSGRPFPRCTDSSTVQECTQDMDSVAFNTYTEFFTHAYSICHYLESEHWQNRAEGTIHRLTQSSADVVQQLASTQRIAEDLVQAQSTALKSQQAILRNGQELKLTLQDSTQGLKEVFANLQDTAREQQVAFSEIFNRVAFLQSFLMSESHTLSSLLYNTLGLCAAFLLTATKRTAGARYWSVYRIILFVLVATNVYLERVICNAVLDTTDSGYQRMERIEELVGLLRRGTLTLGLLVVAYTAVRFRDVGLESLAMLARLRESQSSLELALKRAEYLGETVDAIRVMKREVRAGLRAKQWTRIEDESDGVSLEELSVILPHSSGLHVSPISERPSWLNLEQRTFLDHLLRKALGLLAPNQSPFVIDVAGFAEARLWKPPGGVVSGDPQPLSRCCPLHLSAVSSLETSR